MAVRTQLVPVPLGGGLREDLDAHRVRPPHASAASNATTRKGEAYRKSPGYVSGGTGGSTGTDGAKALLIDPRGRKLVLGQNGQAIAADGSTTWTTLASGFLCPSNLATVPVASPRGHVLDVGVRVASDGSVGVVWREWIDPANGSDPAEWGTGRAAGLVMSPDGTVVGGPWYWEDMHYCPRVEVSTSAGVNAWYFFGLTTSDADELIRTPMTIDIRYARMPSDAWPAAGSQTSTLLRTGVDNTTMSYDTHSDPQASAGRVFVAYAVSGNELRVSRLTFSGSVSVVVVWTDVTQPDMFQVYYHDASSTVIVTESSAWDMAFAFAAGGGTVADYAGIHAENHPRLYTHTTSASNEVVFSGETITITGSNPGILTFSGSAAYNIPPDCYDPQPWIGNDRSCFLVPRTGGFYPDGPSDDLGTLLSGEWELNEEYPGHLEGHFVHSSGLIYSQFDVLEGRHGPLMWDGAIHGSPLGGSGSLYHVPQTDVDPSGRLCVAAHAKIRAIKGYRLSDSSHPTNYTQATVETQSEGHLPNMDRQILLVRASSLQSDLASSAIDQDGTQVLANGGVGLWDGQSVVNLVPQPRISAYTRDTGAGSGSGILMGTTGAGLGGLATGVTAQSDRLTALKIVVVYVDKNGVEWRSAPSPPWVYYELPLNTSFEYPKLEITFNHLAYYRGHILGGRFDVELYTTERDNGNGWAGPATTDFADIVTDYYFVQRSPMLVDGSGNHYIVDLLNFAHNGSYFYPALPLYTDTGELAPAVPPASGVLARSGNYAFLVPSEFPYELWPSKPLEAGRGPEFPPELILYAPSDSGGIVSLAGLNDRLYILCKNGIYALPTVSGPDATGAGGFGPIRRIHVGDGCINHNCTVETPAGVLYTAETGVRMIGLDGIVQNVGGPAEDTLGDPADLIRSVYLREHNEAWFVATDYSVVLNLDTGAWTAETRQDDALDAEARDGEIHFLTASAVRTTDPADGTDVNRDHNMSIASPWLTFDTALGFWRCRRGHVLGRRESGVGDIRVQIAYDYDDAVVDDLQFSYLGSRGMVNYERAMHFTFRPSRQKFDAIKITVSDTRPTSTDGTTESTPSTLVWSLTGLELEVASKQGGIKLQEAAKR